MTPASCPSCGEPIQRLQSNAAKAIAYCPACGWNVARARGVVAYQRRGMLVGLVFVAVLLLIPAASSPNRRNSLEGGLIFASLLGVLGAVGWRKLAQDSRALAGVVRVGYSRARTVPRPDAEILAQVDNARLQPCPRPVRLNQMSRGARSVLRICPIGIWLWGIHDLLLPSRPLGLAARTPVEAQIWGAIMLGLGALLWYLLPRSLENKRQRALLRDGQVALARVTGPFSGSVTSPGITYEFSDANGRTMQGKGAAIYATLNEDDYVAVTVPFR